MVGVIVSRRLLLVRVVVGRLLIICGLLIVCRLLIVCGLFIVYRLLLVVGCIIGLIISRLLHLNSVSCSSVLDYFHFIVSLCSVFHKGTNTNQQEYTTYNNGTNGPIGEFITTTIIIVVIASVPVGTVGGVIRAVAIVVATVLGARMIIAIAVGHLQLYFYYSQFITLY